MLPCMEIVTWTPAPRSPALVPGEVHIWRGWLDRSDTERARLSALLNEEETARANRFVFERDREHFVVARGTLREILSNYLPGPPASFQFATAKFGKLSLPLHPKFRFNVSHSHGLALYAVSLTREVGIDVEKIRPEFTGEDIAARYFSSAEQEELKRVSAAERALAFFLCWTRKEAYIKARGEGLQIPLDSFDVSLTPGRASILRSVDQQRWKVESFTPAADYAAAVMGEGEYDITGFYEAGAVPTASATSPPESSPPAAV
jgi:4'-phosphopantetheinyl transferase